MSEHFEVRDMRGGFLWISNAFFDAYVSVLQPSALIVYVALARLASNATQSCFPSYETLAKTTGLSRATVATCLQELKDTGAIEWRKQGRHNFYFLLETTSPNSGLVQKNTPTSPKNRAEQSSGLDSNKTYNKTYEQDESQTPSRVQKTREQERPF